jgi:hypothetical protein
MHTGYANCCSALEYETTPRNEMNVAEERDSRPEEDKNY